MKKTWVSLIVLSCICLGVQSKTSDPLAEYQASIKSQKNFNQIQRKTGMPEMLIPSMEEWLQTKEKRSRKPHTSTEQKKDQKTRWEKRLEKIRPQLCEVVPVHKKSKSARHIKAHKEKDRLLKAAQKAHQKQPEIERKLDAIAARHGVKRREKDVDGTVRVLSGKQNGYPVWLQNYSQISAAGISADELWPTNSAPWPSSSTGRNLTGTNVVLGMWDVGGGVKTNHQEFSTRVLQQDVPDTLNDHATGVVGTMAAHGNTIALSGLPVGELARGVAFNALIDAYDIKRFNEEITDASAGTTNITGLRTSNHSWGLSPAWRIQWIGWFYYNGQWYFDGNYNYVWDENPNFVEDPDCGYYSSRSDGTGCVEIDALMSTNAPRHLLVYAAGNNRFAGPQQSSFYFYRYQGDWALVNTPPEEDKDWSLGDGDTYGFDTVIAPGTAKNVLTVGSVKDVYHDEGGELTWGYASNSIIHVSDVSNCGPTDDGRIKPDLVAVGEADPSIRSYGMVTPVSTATDSYQTNSSGTSFAAPLVTAGIGLCQERRTQLFPNLDPEVDDWLNSSLKALAIHTADDVLNRGPDYLTGWGLFNAVSAVQQVELDAQHGRGTHIKELELSVGETHSWTVTLDGSPFKATIAWSDLPGIPTGTVDDPTPMLVNNLDLWVENEAGTQIFQPWVLDPDLQQERESVRNTPATTGYDDRNNVEQVEMEAPVPGTYKIFVTHAGGTSGGQPTSDQTVSILTSGDTPLRPKISEFEPSPTHGTFLLSVESDPGAYMIVESCSDLVADSWETDGTFTTVGNTNSILVHSSSKVRFWRIRRETGSNP